MKRVNLHIPIYEWDLSVVSIENKKDDKPFRNVADEFALTDEEYNMVMDEIEHESHDGGETFYDGSQMTILTVLYPMSNEEEFTAIFNHEKRHVVDIIAELMGLECKESTAYLDEYITRELFKLKNDFINIIQPKK